jgi:hypothetical protein
MGHVTQPLSTWDNLGNVLYVGANGLRGREPALIRTLRPRARSIDCLEIHRPNVERVREGGWFDSVRWGDVRTYLWQPGVDRMYDTIVWWHGPEHLTFAEGVSVLEQIPRQLRPRYVWVGCPLGPSPQGKLYDNPNEEHRSEWYPVDFVRLGYECMTYTHRGQRKVAAWLTSTGTITR